MVLKECLLGLDLKLIKCSEYYNRVDFKGFDQKKLIESRKDIMVESAAYEIIKEEGREEGEREGKIEGKLETVKNMLKLGAIIEFIVCATGLS